MKSNATLLLLIVSFFFHTNAKAYSQGITIKVTDATLDKVFSLIQKQTNFVFVYSGKQLAGTKKVSVDVTNEKFEKVMQMVMDGQPLRWEVDKEYVIIKVKASTMGFDNESKPGELTGKVTNEKGEPVAGATVTVKNSNINAATDLNGYFILKGVDPKAELVITSIGYEPRIVKLTGEEKITIKMAVSAQTIKEVIVKGNTGYQVIDRKHPGSFDVINNELIQRSTNFNILDRIQDLTPGLLFDKTVGTSEPLLIRGKNTINSDVNPLIVLDNFPYDGSIDNINPNDVESITVLKDAAAASIWGARAGNGVIVITTKRGKTPKSQLSITSNILITEKANLFKNRTISPSDYIDVEEFLFDKGHYDGLISSGGVPQPLTPVVEILAQKRDNIISQETANNLINSLRKNDVRDDLMNYFYRTGVSQQNALNISGNSNNVSYYFGAGWDRITPNEVGTVNNRITLRTANTFRVTKNLQFDVNISYARSINKSGNSPSSIRSAGDKALYPYADLVDENGNAEVLVKDFRSAYTDTVGNGQLLDWKYRPYSEINARESSSRLNDFLINVAGRYKIFPSLSVDFSYQFQNQLGSFSSLAKMEDYSTRNLINLFYQPNGINQYPVPLGGIMNLSSSELISHQGRAQVNFNKNFGKHTVTSLLGGEIKNVQSKDNGSILYGYNREGSSVAQSMDFVNFYPSFIDPFALMLVPNSQSIGERLDRLISYFANASYNYDNRYSVYLSAREDAANIFGAKTNQRGVPLWSTGITWQLSNEQFYKIQWLPSLKFRISYGYSGNYNRNVSAYSVMTITSTNNIVGATTARIVTPPNENLRWEKNGRLNIGVDFGTKSDKITGSIELYKSYNKDLVSSAPIDPTLGTSRLPTATILQNVAHIKGGGMDLNIATQNINTREFNWTTNATFSYAYTKVTKLLIPAPTSSSSFVSGTFHPIVGKPVNGWYSYKWAGLDPLTGDPQGFLGKDLSKDYYSLLNKTNPVDLVYNGPSAPPYFGSIRNSFSWKSIRLSFNISYRFGYYVRRSSVAYGSLFYNWTGHSDYASRWKAPGDEKITNVPSMSYPADFSRDAFYLNSEVLMIKGDHIRLNDLRLDYTLTRKSGSKFPFQQLQLYSYLYNLNILLWKQNKDGVDPNILDYPTGKQFSFGLNLVF